MVLASVWCVHVCVRLDEAVLHVLCVSISLRACSVCVRVSTPVSGEGQWEGLAGLCGWGSKGPRD